MNAPDKKVICGMDEVGRGALAGPIVAASVILPPFISIENVSLLARSPIRDSKTLSKLQKQRVKQAVDELMIPYTLESVSPHEINTKGITWANKAVFRRLIQKTKATQYIIDGNLTIDYIHGKSASISILSKADTKIPTVMLASIIAKVSRDAMMEKLHCRYPKYDWHKNAGYGTKKHIECIVKYGHTPVHRTQFVTSALKHYKHREKV